MCPVCEIVSVTWDGGVGRRWSNSLWICVRGLNEILSLCGCGCMRKLLSVCGWCGWLGRMVTVVVAVVVFASVSLKLQTGHITKTEFYLCWAWSAT